MPGAARLPVNLTEGHSLCSAVLPADRSPRRGPLAELVRELERNTRRDGRLPTNALPFGFGGQIAWILPSAGIRLLRRGGSTGDVPRSGVSSVFP